MNVRYESDYAPGTWLYITQTEDGDVALRISGDGEFRIATSGGKLHGKQLVECCNGFERVIKAIKEFEDGKDGENERQG